MHSRTIRTAWDGQDGYGNREFTIGEDHMAWLYLELLVHQRDEDQFRVFNITIRLVVDNDYDRANFLSKGNRGYFSRIALKSWLRSFNWAGVQERISAGFNADQLGADLRQEFDHGIDHLILELDKQLSNGARKTLRPRFFD